MPTDKTILIDDIGAFTQVAWLADGELEDYEVEEKHAGSRIGDVYLGHVERVIESLNAAFVDIGEERAAFLPLGSAKDSGPSIFPGQRIAVQLKRFASATKAARVSTDITLAGSALVYRPNGSGVTVSNRIADKRLKRALRDELLAWLADNSVGGGFIIRSSVSEVLIDAEDHEADLIKEIVQNGVLAEKKRHATAWQDSLKSVATMTKPQCLVRAPNLIQRVFAHADSQEAEIVFSALEHDQWLASQGFDPHSNDSNELGVAVLSKAHQGQDSLFDAWSVGEQVRSLGAQMVNLPSGGSLVFDHNEAMTTVDVNSSAAIQGSNGDLALQINLEACEALATQARLRDLGGLLVIDFINMKSDLDRKKVFNALSSALKKDSAHTKISSFSQFGLLEMQRSRSGNGLQSLLFEECSLCQGKGFMSTAVGVADQIVRELVCSARNESVAAYTIKAHQAVISVLQLDLSDELRKFGNDYECELTLSPDTQYLQSDYDIVLA